MNVASRPRNLFINDIFTRLQCSSPPLRPTPPAPSGYAVVYTTALITSFLLIVGIL